VARHHTPLDELVRRFRRSPGEPRVLLAGTTGTGKTTELIGFAAEMSADRPVVFVDLVRVYDRIGDADALQRVHPWEVVFQIGVAAALGLPPAEREARAQALLDAFAALVRPAAPASAPAGNARCQVRCSPRRPISSTGVPGALGWRRERRKP
jgi:hypothetical protein